MIPDTRLSHSEAQLQSIKDRIKSHRRQFRKDEDAYLAAIGVAKRKSKLALLKVERHKKMAAGIQKTAIKKFAQNERMYTITKDTNAALIQLLAKTRQTARDKKDFEISDLIRSSLQELGFGVDDTRGNGTIIWKNPQWYSDVMMWY